MGVSAAKAKDRASANLQGEIRSTTIPHLFHDLSVARVTGTLTLSNREVHKTVQLHQGRVLFASSTDRDDRLGQFLLRENVISLENLLKALEVGLATQERLGEVMVQRKLMTPEEVQKWVRVQVLDIVCSMFSWTSGHYSFEEQPASTENITVGMTGDSIVVEGIRRMRSWARAYEEIGGLNTEYRTTRDMPAIVKDLPARPAEKAILDLCDAPTSLGEICQASSMGDFEVCQSVWWMYIVGALMKA